MKRETRLYNVMFPLWFLLFFPAAWLVVLPANFLIDLLVLFLVFKLGKMPDIGKNLRSAILKTWLLGFAADLVGGGAMFLGALAGEFLPSPVRQWVYHNVTEAVMLNPFSSVGGFLWTAGCTALAGFLIYLFNRKIALKNAALSDAQKKKATCWLAVRNAPYLFFLPTTLLYF